MEDSGVSLTQGPNQQTNEVGKTDIENPVPDAKFYAKISTNKNITRAFTPKSSCFFASESQPSVATVMGSINMFEIF